MATVTYTRTFSYPNQNPTYYTYNYFNLDRNKFTAPSGYTWSYVQFTCTNGYAEYDYVSGDGTTGLVNLYRGNNLISRSVNWKSQGAKTYTYTDSLYASASSYGRGTSTDYCYYGIYNQSNLARLYITNPKFIIAFKKTYNVTAGNPIKKTDFDAIGWAATVGSPISHSGMSGIIYASTFNSQSTTINEAISGSVGH